MTAKVGLPYFKFPVGGEVFVPPVHVGGQFITDTDRIQKPVDYHIIDDKRDKFRKGTAPWQALRNIFRE